MHYLFDYMNEYKYSEDCFQQKEKFDELIEQVPDKKEYDPIQKFISFIDQLNNYDQISIEDLSNGFEYANNYIQYFPERENDTLLQCIESSSLCSDIIRYFLDNCQSQQSALQIPESYFIFVSTITRKTSFFSDVDDYFKFVFHLIEYRRLFPANIEVSISNIIIFILMSCTIPEFLSELYFSPQHEDILTTAIEHNIEDKFGIKTGAQTIVKKLYISLINYSEDVEITATILSNFFGIHKENNYYGDYSYNDGFIIEICIAALNKFLETYSIIYSDNPEYFTRLFNYLQVSNNFSYSAFHLITLIILNPEFTREDPPDLDNFLNDERWGNIMNFFEQRGRYKTNDITMNFKKMLLFSAAYLRFGSAFFYKFECHDFFTKLLELMNNKCLTFSESVIAVKCLSNAIIFSGSETQIYSLFEKGVLPVFLSILENDSDEELTREILESIRIIYEVCKNAADLHIEEIPPTAAEEFTTLFAEESGFEILMDLKTCADMAQSLNELIDPPSC